MVDDNDHGRFWAICVDQLKIFFITQRGVPCSGKKRINKLIWQRELRENNKSLEAYDYEESERKRRSIVESDGTMLTFTQDAMHQMAPFVSAV